VLAAVAGIATVGMLIGHRGSVTAQSDQQVLEQLAIQAEVAPLTLPFEVLGNTFATDGTVAGTASSPNVAVATSDAGVQATQAQASSALQSIYAPGSPELAARQDTISRAINALRGSGTHMIAAGIRNVAFQSVISNGSSATVTMTFTSYSIGVDTAPDGHAEPFSPQNNMIAVVTFVNTNSGWRVSSTQTNFAPGSEP
jgi:hypothetical protein